MLRRLRARKSPGTADRLGETRWVRDSLHARLKSCVSSLRSAAWGHTDFSSARSRWSFRRHASNALCVRRSFDASVCSTCASATARVEAGPPTFLVVLFRRPAQALVLLLRTRNCWRWRHLHHLATGRICLRLDHPQQVARSPKSLRCPPE